MLKITGLKINSITLSGFRSYKDETILKMGDLTFISGHNGKGKSSIAHAIAYAFYGVDAFGVQDIDRIRNNKCNTVSVKLDFTDEKSNAHSFSRTRKGDTTKLDFDGHTVTQGFIDSTFCSKETFLALFNPTYFIEVMGNAARSFIELRLPKVEADTVLARLTEKEREFLKDADFTVPEATIKNLREKIKEHESNKSFINGQLSELEGADKKTQVDGINKRIAELKASIKNLGDRQFEGLNILNLEAELCMLDDKLKEGDSQQLKEKLGFLESVIFEVESRDYHSKLAPSIKQKTDELSILANNYNNSKVQYDNLQIGAQCPTCCIEITADNIAGIKNGLEIRLKELLASGKAEKEKLAELQGHEKKFKDTFDEFKTQDLAKAKQDLDDFKKAHPNNHSEIYNRINEIKRILKLGNLSETECKDLADYNNELNHLKARLGQLESVNTEKKAAELREEISKIEANQAKAKEIIRAVQEYIAKRSEIALSGFKTQNVAIKLYEIIKSTGELKPCFKFLYDGREYPTLSLSEKIKAGLEVSEMLRSVLKLDYPVFIDNSESIGNFDGIGLPSQTFILKFVKDTPLKVVFKNTANLQAAA